MAQPSDSLDHNVDAPEQRADLDPGRDSAERVQSRPYSSPFAALPASELEGVPEHPGPVGSTIDGIAWSLVAVAAGYVLLLLGMFFGSFIVLGLGLLVLLGGAVWRLIQGQRRR